MKPLLLIILKYSVILLALFLILWWIFEFSSFDIPQRFPHTPLRIYGFCLTVTYFVVLIFSQKEAVRKDGMISVTKLTIVGLLISFFMELIFQIFLSFTYDSGRIYHFVSGVLSTTAVFGILSFFSAYQIKTKRTGRLVLFIIVLIVMVRIIMFFPYYSLRNNWFTRLFNDTSSCPPITSPSPNPPTCLNKAVTCLPKCLTRHPKRWVL